MKARTVATPTAAAFVFLLAAAGAPAAASAATSFNPATFATQSVKPGRLTAPVQMTKDEPAPARAFTGPTSMLVAPDNPRIVVAATADLRTRVCQLLVSADAGHTWHFSKALPAPSTHPNCTNGSAGVAEASIAWGRNGTLYYAMNGFGPNEGSYAEGHTSMVLAWTTDLGKTWKTTLVENNRGKPSPAPADFGATVAVDTSAGPADVVSSASASSTPTPPRTRC